MFFIFSKKYIYIKNSYFPFDVNILLKNNYKKPHTGLILFFPILFYNKIQNRKKGVVVRERKAHGKQL